MDGGHAALDEDVELFCVAAVEDGRGVGAEMYRHLFATLADEPIHRAYAGITLPNAASLALHRQFGFRDVGLYDEVGFKLGMYWSVQWLEKPMPFLDPPRQ